MPTNFSTLSVPVSRRRLLATPDRPAGPATLMAPESPVVSYAPRRLVDPQFADPVGRAYHFLDVVQDAYVKGGEPRLLQSYNNESGLMTAAFVYDNALAVLAYLANPTVANVRRARLVADALLWIQEHDETYEDGRVRQAYAAGPMVCAAGGPAYPGLRRTDGTAAHLEPYGFGGSSTGDVAWAGLALAQLYVDTRIPKYLDGAVRLAEWVARQESPYRFGGYHGGVKADGETPQTWTSTEHNIDAYALFMLLGKLTRSRRWSNRAAVAADFVEAMWHQPGRHFWTGTLGGDEGADPNEINTTNIPEDAQTWSLLALGDRRRGSVDWVTGHLRTTDGGAGSELPAGVTVSGITYSTQATTLTAPVAGGDVPNHRNAVWLEGTAHTALALLHRDEHGDAARARRLLREAVTAQTRVGAGQTVGRTADPVDGRLSSPAEGGTWTGTPLPARSGIVAATSALDTGFAFSYFQRQHVGASAWFLMAAQNFNPYR